MIRGDPGIGKSALVEWAAERAESERLRVMRASGVTSEAQLPFAGLHQLLMPLLSHERRLPSSQEQALLGALGMQGDAPDIFMVGLAVLTLLSDEAAEGALLVVAEDAHWLDAQTLQVLAFVAPVAF